MCFFGFLRLLAYLDAPIQGLELLVQNLSRLDESNEEDAKGVNTTMGVLENLLEVGAVLLFQSEQQRT